MRKTMAAANPCDLPEPRPPLPARYRLGTSGWSSQHFRREGHGLHTGGHGEAVRDRSQNATGPGAADHGDTGGEYVSRFGEAGPYNAWHALRMLMALDFLLSCFNGLREGRREHQAASSRKACSTSATLTRRQAATL